LNRAVQRSYRGRRSNISPSGPTSCTSVRNHSHRRGNALIGPEAVLPGSRRASGMCRGPEKIHGRNHTGMYCDCPECTDPGDAHADAIKQWSDPMPAGRTCDVALLHPPILIHRTIPGGTSLRKFSPTATGSTYLLHEGPPSRDRPANLRGAPSGRRTSPGRSPFSCGASYGKIDMCKK
jgi:hypothetical protein